MLTDLISTYTALIKSNPVVGGIVSVWFLAIGSYFSKNLPRKLWGFIRRKVSYSVTVNNRMISNNMYQFEHVRKWVMSQKWSEKASRFIWQGSYASEWDDPTPIIVDDGVQYFWRKGRFHSLRRTTSREKEGDLVSITLTIWTFRKKAFDDLLKEVYYIPDKRKRSITTWNGKEYDHLCSLPNRDLKTVVTSGTLKEDLVSLIQEFLDSESWYKERGIPWKLAILLYGPAGTGKTSLIRAVANSFDRNINSVNLNDVSDTGFLMALSKAGKKSIVVIEDADTHPATKPRGDYIEAAVVPKPDEATDKPKEDIFQKLSLQGLLNGLDGIVPLDGKIIIMTANSDNFDEALTRDGRVDHRILMSAIGDDEMYKYVNLYFPEHKLKDRTGFIRRPGSEAQALYFKHRNSPSAFIEALKSPRVVQFPSPETVVELKKAS